jgi:ketosteroid isomerase-like protein
MSAADAGLNDLTEMEIGHIEHACARVYHRIAVAADAGFAGYEDCFTDDVVWVRPDMEMHGHGEMRAFLNAELARMQQDNPPHGHLLRHMYTTILIDVTSPIMALGKAYALNFRDERFDGTMPAPMNTPELIAAYQSEFRKTDKGWRISRHTARHIFRR